VPELQRKKFTVGKSSGGAMYEELQDVDVKWTKGMYLLCRTNTDREFWVLVPRNEEGQMCLRSGSTLIHAHDNWFVWTGDGIRKANEKPREDDEVYGFAGKLENVLEKLKAAGLEEEHLEIHGERGFFTGPPPKRKRKPQAEEQPLDKMFG
jgi:hypothetical protein